MRTRQRALRAQRASAIYGGSRGAAGVVSKTRSKAAGDDRRRGRDYKEIYEALGEYMETITRVMGWDEPTTASVVIGGFSSTAGSRQKHGGACLCLPQAHASSCIGDQ